MARTPRVEAQLHRLMADDRCARRDAWPSSAQKMADALSSCRSGGGDETAAPLFCAALRESLARLVQEDDVDLHKAMVWHRFPEVRQYTRLIDSEAYRAAVHAAKKLGDLAYPARIEREPDVARKDMLMSLAAAVRDARAGRGDWTQVIASAAALDVALAEGATRHVALLAEKQHLQQQPGVIDYLALRRSTRPMAGGAARGRSVEDHVGSMLARLSVAMNEASGEPSGTGYRIARGAHVPPALRPGDRRHIKGEIDFLLMHGDDVVLVGETKAGGATAISVDCVKFHNAVVEMAARAQADETYSFRLVGKGTPQFLHISGASLNRLNPSPAAPAQDAQPTWPARARYFLPECVAGIPLSQRAMAYLTQHPVSLDLAQALMAGTPMPAEALMPVWQALAVEPRLAWIWQEQALAEQALHAVHGSDSIARFTGVFARLAVDPL
ncbi:hypothetical protein [Stenotrophomonas sp.]|uniref:hypothetical protein n=1 Tax=Stenotrophomonas sp. TaxID=69392 RepID=UPI0028A8B604|nr:hypothetical protein [Stenotrophomonas sp.]